MASSSDFRPLPRTPGQRKFVGPSGEVVSEWYVRKLRAQEQGFATPRQVTALTASRTYRKAVAETAQAQDRSPASVAIDKEFNQAFREAFVGERGRIRTWAEAEAHNAERTGWLLMQQDAITEAMYYRYFKGGI